MEHKDLENGPYNFRTWIIVMTREWYLPLFVLFLGASITIPLVYGMWYIGIDILFGIVMLVLAYKGFYQRWQDFKAKKSR